MNLHISHALFTGLMAATLAGCDNDDSHLDKTDIASPSLLSKEVIEVNEFLETVSFTGGETLTLDVGVGSGAFHFQDDNSDEFYTITDRGPNIACNESTQVLGIDDFCRDDNGRIFPVPNFTPTIYKFDIDAGDVLGTYDVIQTIKLKDRDDNPISGLPNTTENAYNKNGNRLDFDPEGVDTEAIVKLSNGTFWLAEEYSPSLIHIAANGRILERIVPAGVESDLAAANYRIIGALPAILKKLHQNRGIESLALSPDEDFLYFIMESPLANPDEAAYKKSRYVRLFKVSLRYSDLDSLVAEYVYVLDEPDTFTADNTNQQSDVKISEMVALDTDKLIILERVTRHTKLYRLSKLDDATNILGTEWDNEAITPSLERLSDLTAQGIISLEKKRVFDSRRDLSDLDSKIEGIALLDNEYLAFINDNDFGIKGAQTRIRIEKRVELLNQ
ncbi:MAG: esterase-like activity of phytase family protein [Pseudomonadota bacterium]